MNIDETFKALAELKMAQKKLENEADELMGQIKKYMTDNKLTELIGEEHRALYRMVSQSRIDSTKLREEHPRIAKKYTVDNSYMRFNFT